MNFSLNIHSVTDIVIGPVRENISAGKEAYATRIIEIKTKEGGDFEITLFSVHVSEDDDTPLLAVQS